MMLKSALLLILACGFAYGQGTDLGTIRPVISRPNHVEGVET